MQGLHIQISEYESGFQNTARSYTALETTRKFVAKLQPSISTVPLDLFIRLKRCIDVLSCQLPESIDISSSEVQGQIKVQMEKVRRDDSKVEWRKLRKATLSSSIGPVTPGRKRLIIHEILKSEVVRSVAPVYAIALFESEVFNKYVSNLKTFISNSVSGLLKFYKTNYEKIIEVVNMLENGFIPRVFSNSCELERVSAWIRKINRRRTMLHYWLTKGLPEEINLNDISDPKALFHATREQYAMIENIPVEETKIKTDIVHPNFSCTEAFDFDESFIMKISGISLKRGLWDFDKKLLQCENILHKKQNEVAILISVKSVTAPIDDDLFYICPLFVNCKHSIRSYDNLFYDNDKASDYKFSLQRELVLTVPLRVSEESVIEKSGENVVEIFIE